jgi:hypothetical protein
MKETIDRGNGGSRDEGEMVKKRLGLALGKCNQWEGRESWGDKKTQSDGLILRLQVKFKQT